MTAAEAAIYESLVVSRYMRAFGRPAVPMLIPHAPAIIAHLGCRTGYPAELIVEHMPGCSMTGVDSSATALELARTKTSLLSGVNAEYVQSEGYPTPLRAGAYTHSIGLHPFGYRGDYKSVFSEHQRVLTSGGQMVLSLPLRGSFPEIYDMLREYALRHDQPHFGEAVDAAASRRPNPETLSEAIESAGFTHVDVGVELVGITFENGRDFLEDPISRLVVGPDVIASLAVDSGVNEAWHYVAEAVGKYWSEIPFELTVNIGSVSARRI
jgi:ubiquinone/menaquinone biosynthesis C-methylase UbiE